MNHQSQRARHLVLSIDDLVDTNGKAIRKSLHACIIAVICLFLWLGPRTDPEMVLAAALVFIAGCLPAILWATRKCYGLPIVPAIALYDVLWFGFPMLRGHAELQGYSPAEILRAASAESLFLALMCLVWFQICRRKVPPPPTLYLFGQTHKTVLRLIHFSLSGLLIATAYAVSFRSGDWYLIQRFLPVGFAHPVHAGFALVAYLSLFLLSFCFGAGLLSARQKMTFSGLALLYGLAIPLSLFLSPLVPLVAAVCGGYAVSSGRFPWRILVPVVLVVNVLHMGKDEMRGQHWELYQYEKLYVYPTGYPELYAEWIDYGFSTFAETGRRAGGKERTDILDRMSMMQMLMNATTLAPDVVPFLHGESYARSAGSLVPRFFWPTKPGSHDGQALLNVYFGMQTEEETEKTAIAWGMLSEAWANFGWAGAVGLGAVFGLFFGMLGRVTINVPVASLRFAMAALIMVIAIGASQSGTFVWITSLFQACLLSFAGCTALVRKSANPLAPAKGARAGVPREHPVAATG